LYLDILRKLYTKHSTNITLLDSNKKMDFQNRAGAKPGSGGVASLALIESDRRER
jgi:hypothetical protein